jgi:hypothetical protein
MSNKSIILAMVLLVVTVLGMFGFAYLQQGEVESKKTDVATTTSNTQYGISRIEATHFYRDGIHTIVGEISLPTPCDLLVSDSQVAESYPEQVTFLFTIINNSETCAQIVTTQRFSVNATASIDALLKATFMGNQVELNLREAAPGETPEDFEVFMKG